MEVKYYSGRWKQVIELCVGEDEEMGVFIGFEITLATVKIFSY